MLPGKFPQGLPLSFQSVHRQQYHVATRRVVAVSGGEVDGEPQADGQNTHRQRRCSNNYKCTISLAPMSL